MKTFAILVLLLITPFVVSETCGVRRIQHGTLYYQHNGGYHKYVSGNYGQLYTYNQGHYQPYYENVVLVPKAIQVEVHRDHYYSIDSAAQQSLLADAIVGRLLRLQQNTSNGTGRLPTGPATQNSTSPTGDSSKPDTQEPKPGNYQNETLLKVINNSCVKCHGVNSKYTKLVTADGKLNDLPSGKVWESFGLANSGEMPKGGKALTDEEIKLFYEWAKNAKR